MPLLLKKSLTTCGSPSLVESILFCSIRIVMAGYEEADI